jgi:8-oxo-dGTP pyrophosphatase MutT (NUDIX family)
VETLRIYNGPHSLVLTQGSSSQAASSIMPKAAADWLQAPNETVLPVWFQTTHALQDFFDSLCTHFRWVEAAGGVVANEAGHILLMHRRGMWDLPKGKIDAGESPTEAACREITEETGLHQLKLTRRLLHTYHVYKDRGHWWLKKTYWFTVLGSATETLVPQTTEDITALVWVPITDGIQNSRYPTYPTITEVLTAYAGTNV